eukprot:1183349-Prorocentrum_minimum.AAC.1
MKKTFTLGASRIPAPRLQTCARCVSISSASSSLNTYTYLAFATSVIPLQTWALFAAEAFCRMERSPKANEGALRLNEATCRAIRSRNPDPISKPSVQANLLMHANA